MGSQDSGGRDTAATPHRRHRARHTATRWVRRAALLAAVALAGSGTVLTVSQAAQAYGDHLSGYEALDGATFFGVMDFPNGNGICLSSGAAVPTATSNCQAYTAEYEAYVIWYLWHNRNGLPATSDDAAALAFALKQSGVLPHPYQTSNLTWADMPVSAQNAMRPANDAWEASQGWSITDSSVNGTYNGQPVPHKPHPEKSADGTTA